MTITELNGEVLNTKELYIHDDILLSLNFDRNSKIMVLKLAKCSDSIQTYIIRCMDVIGFIMTACDYWCVSECVLDFEYVPQNERVLIPQLENKWNSIPDSLQKDSYDGYIETLLTFSSGDQLTIACKTIEIVQ